MTRGQRAAAYVRVSSEEQTEGFSLDAQERAIDGYCRDHGYDIVARYRDEGQQRPQRRPDQATRFSAHAGRCRGRRFDVVIVHKLDRFARNLRVTLDTLDRLERAGVGFVSISENMDFATPDGASHAVSMMGALGQFYSDNLSHETKKGKAERKAQGLYNGLLPFGVTTDGRGVPILDREVRYCDVATRREIVPAEGLELAFDAGRRRPERSRDCSRLERGRVSHQRQSRHEPVHERHRAPAAAQPLLPGPASGRRRRVASRQAWGADRPDLFKAAQTARERNTRKPRRVCAVRTPWALSGIGVCSCGASMIATGRPATAGAVRRQRTLRCAGRIQGRPCDAPSFAEDKLNEQLTTGILAKFAVDGVGAGSAGGGMAATARAEQ